jgi:hypothetical protein
MPKRLVRVALIVILFCAIPFVRAQESPVALSGCELAKTPKDFDGKLIRVRGGLNVHFEDFTLGIGNCDSEQGIWLAFGGDVPGIVASTANDNFRKPGSDFKVNGVSYNIKKDDNFRRLYALIASHHADKADYEVTATITGLFLAGEESKYGKGNTVIYSGYGHLGCCALLVITQVSEVESVPPANLNVHGTVVGPSGKPVEGFTVFDDVLGGSPPERQTTITDKRGEFSFSNSGQQLRFEDPKYRPLAVTVEPGRAPVRVKLQDAEKSTWVIPPCGNADSGSRIGFAVLFAIPQTMESSRPDNEMQTFFVYPKGSSAPEAELMISRTADETKDAADSLDSNWIVERWAKDSAGNVIGIDARGRRKDGNFWRTALFFGHDMAGYWLRSGGKPDDSDKVIDSACLAKIPAR